jgi:DNA polymerase III subunit beta
MEIKILRSEILRGLSLVQSIVERKTTMPILANVLLETRGKTLSITATDLEVGINSSYNAEVVSAGKVAIHARSVYDIIKELPEENVHIKVLDGNWVQISCGKSNFKIVGLASDEFPTLPNKGDGESRRVEGSFLKDMIDKTSFAMSTDETRYNLNGVYIDEKRGDKGSKVKMVATDGHRLSIVERDFKAGWNLKKGVIVPRKGIMELKKLCENGDAQIELWMDEKHLMAYRDNVTLVVRLIDGQFPPYDQVVPKKIKKVVSMTKDDLSRALKRVSVLSTDRTRGVKFSFSPKNLDIFASNPDMGEAHEEISARYKGESFEVGFNAKYVLEALNSIVDDEAVLQLGDETSPCVLQSEKDSGFTHVIMPMRL